MAAPTVAEVAWVTEFHRHTPMGALRTCAPDCVACSLLARLDPGTMVLVTRDSLARALNEHFEEGRHGWSFDSCATAVWIALRGDR